MIIIILTDSSHWKQSSMEMFGKCNNNLNDNDFLFCEELKSAQFFTFIGKNLVFFRKFI